MQFFKNFNAFGESMRPSRLVVAVLLLAGRPELAAAQTATEKLLAESDAAIQAQIGAVFDAKSEIEAFQHTQALKGLARDKAELVKQLAIFEATSSRKHEMHVLMTLIILGRLDVQPSTSFRTLAPYLDSENEGLREFAEEWFQGYSGAASDDPLEAYASYIGGQLARGEEVPAALIEHMHQRLPPERVLLIFIRASRSPVAAAQIKAINKRVEARRQGREISQQEKEEELRREKVQRQRGEERREILLAEHLVSSAIWLKKNGFGEEFVKLKPEAREQLAKLSGNEHWWARLYVAEIMGRHFSLRLPEVLDKLSEDENALVREAAKAAKVSRGTAIRGTAARPVDKLGDGRQTQALVAPREVESRPIGSNSIKVTWQPSVGATSYRVIRRQPDTETEYTVVAPNVIGTEFIDTGLVKGTLYEYRVIAQQDP
jgi:hypothetical protein